MKKHTGGCHCKAVRFEVLSDLDDVIECNCSICSKRGWLLTFVPIDQFKVLSGDEILTRYQFNKQVIDHLFCKICGTASFGRGKGPDGIEMAAINVRCLEGVDLSTLSITKYNGKDA